MVTDYVALTESIVKRIVDSPDAVEVVAESRGRTTVIEVAAAETDIGKIIGKGGRNIEAIRVVVRAAGLRQHERIQVELRDDDGPAVRDAVMDTELTESEEPDAG